jgi:stage III sporulation protein AH
LKRIFKKNQIIITTLAIMIAIAGYLNYSGKILDEKADAVSTDDTTVLVTDGSGTDTTYTDVYSDIVSLEDDGLQEASLAEEDTASAGVGEAVLASSSQTGSSILAAAKLNREQVRAKSKEELQEMIDNTDISEEQKENAITVMTQMSQNAEMEANAELLLEAKGFTGAVVSISDNTADVVVDAAELSAAERAQIEDIVKRKTEIPGENIVITPQGSTTGSTTDTE